MSAVPQVAELIAFRTTLASELSAEEVHDLVIARARELGLSLGGVAGDADATAPPSLLDTSLWDLLDQVLAALRTQFGEMTAREALERLSASLGLDAALVSYVEQSAASGTPAAFPLPLHGVVFPVPAATIGDFETPPMVCLLASQFSDIEQLSRDLRDQARETFKDCSAPQLSTWEELARIAELFKQDQTREEITWQLLADRFPEIAAASDEERKRDYYDEYKRKRASLYRKFNRIEKSM